ncbi:MAG: SDR family oxidoreductase [Candidatus Eremiobacteraeota bacterium]|nr:SDR family oxidoreductase [Candidatus Eremiobacteraeota bacterium]
MSSKRKVALVTGAGSGIGRAVASALGRAGFAVVLAGRRADQLENVARAIRGGNAEALAVPTDVRDPDAVAALFAATKSAFGRLDLLFNNAGINAPPTPIEELAVEAWKAIVDTNLSGMFYCTQAAVRLMKAQDPQGGRIVNNGSLAAYAPRPNTIAYTATKHAVSGLTRSTSLDGRKYNIACGQIDIGNAATEMTAAYASGAPQAAGTVVVEPRLDLDHIAEGVLYMANLPLDANVLFMTVMATKMPFVGRG